MKRLLLSLFLVIGLAGPVHAAGMNMLGSGSTAMRMMEAMWDMMEWFFNQRDANQNGVPWNYRYPASPWTYSYPTNPWNRNFANPWSYAQGPNAPGGMPGAGPWSGKGPGTTPFDNLTLWSPLDGIWRVSTGEYWIVQGNQFARPPARPTISASGWSTTCWCCATSSATRWCWTCSSRRPATGSGSRARPG